MRNLDRAVAWGVALVVCVAVACETPTVGASDRAYFTHPSDTTGHPSSPTAHDSTASTPAGHDSVESKPASHDTVSTPAPHDSTVSTPTPNDSVVSTPTPSDSVVSWTFCVNAGNVCEFLGLRVVRLADAGNTRAVTQTAYHSVPCAAYGFNDRNPAPGAPLHCDYGPVKTTTLVNASPMGPLTARAVVVP